jgi:uncharacterized protein (TIRG00374 family)
VSIGRWMRHPALWVPVSTLLIGTMVWRSRLWEAAATLSLVDPPALLAAAAISGIVPVLWAARSSDLLTAAGRPVSLPRLVPMTLFANMINNLTPGSSGEIVRIWLLRTYHGVDTATGAAVIAIERLGAFGYLAGSAVLVWLGHIGGWPPAVVIALVAALVAAPGIAYGLGMRPSALVAALPLSKLLGEARWTRATAWVRRVDGTMASLLAHPVRLAVFALLTFGVLAGYSIQLVLVARALGQTLDPVAAWGALGLSITAGVLSMLPFGLGSTDLVLVALLGVLGISEPAAAATALGYRIVSTLPLGLGGVISYAWLSARLPKGGAGGVMRALRDAPAEDPAPDATPGAPP